MENICLIFISNIQNYKSFQLKQRNNKYPTYQFFQNSEPYHIHIGVHFTSFTICCPCTLRLFKNTDQKFLVFSKTKCRSNDRKLKT